MDTSPTDATALKAYLTASEVAEILRLSPHTVSRWARSGLLPAVRVGRTYRFEREAIDAKLLAGRIAVPAPREVTP